MTCTLDIKSSSRAGRFKKKLVSLEALQTEAPLIEQKMVPFLKLFHQKKLSAAELTATYIITVLSHRFPGTWLGSKVQVLHDHEIAVSLSELPFEFEPSILKRLSGFKTLGDVFQNFSFRSTPLSINRAVLHWSSSVYPLILMFCIPSSREVLEQQKNGRRCVTILTDAKRTRDYILGERDALSFTLHDLIHADHFYQDHEHTIGQKGFYRLMDQSLNEGHFGNLLRQEGFSREFDYLISDMNAYPVHLMKCFKSALLFYGEEEFGAWVASLPFDEKMKRALIDLNTDQYRAEDQDQIILDFLTKNF